MPTDEERLAEKQEGLSAVFCDYDPLTLALWRSPHEVPVMLAEIQTLDIETQATVSIHLHQNMKGMPQVLLNMHALFKKDPAAKRNFYLIELAALVHQLICNGSPTCDIGTELLDHLNDLVSMEQATIDSARIHEIRSLWAPFIDKAKLHFNDKRAMQTVLTELALTVERLMNRFKKPESDLLNELKKSPLVQKYAVSSAPVTMDEKAPLVQEQDRIMERAMRTCPRSRLYRTLQTLCNGLEGGDRLHAILKAKDTLKTETSLSTWLGLSSTVGLRRDVERWLNQMLAAEVKQESSSLKRG